MCYCLTPFLHLGIECNSYQCVNTNKSAFPDLLAMHYISYESSIPQLSVNIVHNQLMLGDEIGGQNDYHYAGTFSRSIARMTSQIRPLLLIRRRGGLHWPFALQRLADRIEKVRTSITISEI